MNLDLVFGGDLSVDRPVDRDGPCHDRGANIGIGPDDQRVPARLDAPFDAAVDGQVLGADQLAPEDDGLADPGDQAALLGRTPRRCLLVQHTVAIVLVIRGCPN
jgi:hypothetical protein